MFVWYCRLLTRNRIFVSDYNQTAWWHTHTIPFTVGRFQQQTSVSHWHGALTLTSVCSLSVAHLRHEMIIRLTKWNFSDTSYKCSAFQIHSHSHSWHTNGASIWSDGIGVEMRIKNGIDELLKGYFGRHKEIYIEGLTFSLSVILYRKWTKREHEKRGKIRKACGSPSNQIHFKNWL